MRNSYIDNNKVPVTTDKENNECGDSMDNDSAKREQIIQTTMLPENADFGKENIKRRRRKRIC